MASVAINNFTIYYQSCGGLRSKLVDLRLNSVSSDYDMIVLTETWLQSGVYDAELLDCKYAIVRNDRNVNTSTKKDGGGVLVAINSKFSMCRRTDLEDSALELIVIMLPSKNMNFFVCAVYIPPASGNGVYERLVSVIERISKASPDSTLCLIGDFNMPHIYWEIVDNSCAVQFSNVSGEGPRLVMETTAFHNLNQYNHVFNKNDRLLDLVFCNRDCTVTVPDFELSRVDSHHPALLVTLQLAPLSVLKALKTPRHNFLKADYDTINTKLIGIDWSQEFGSFSAAICVDRFYEIIYSLIDEHVPIKYMRPEKFPIWFSRALIRTLKCKLKVFNKWRVYKSQSDYLEYSLLRARCKRLMKACFSEYIKNTEHSVSSNIKVFWHYIKSLKRNKVGYPKAMKYNNKLSDTPSETADLFSTFFSSVFEPGTNNDILSLDFDNLESSSSAPNLASITLDIIDVAKALNSLDVNKGPGPDKISPIFLKNTGKTIATPLCTIFNKCLNEGTFPDRWKLAFITPLYKSGSRAEVSNYRPISILSSIPKVFESIVHGIVYSALEPHIINQQHGFMMRKSTVSNLLIYSNFLFESMDKGVQVDSVYTDFRKAFDKVDHLILLKKLAFNGIKGNLLRWFLSYVSNRQQAVVINGHTSRISPVTSGVVQGSILGALLYTLFVNDISSCFKHSHFLMFADDLKIYRPIKNITDSSLLQEDLDRFNGYCDRNGLKLAYDKCNIISFTKNFNKFSAEYHIGGHVLSRVSSVRDLGVIFDEKLKFDLHIESICTKAYQMLGFVLRSTKPFQSATTYIILYQALVRSHLEYASVIWNPFYTIYSTRLEIIQKKFLRSLNYRMKRPYISYIDLLPLYNLLALTDRRIFLDASNLYKICNNGFNCPELLLLVAFHVPSRKTRTRRLFSLPLCRTNSGKRAPLYRVCDVYDKLLSEIDLFGSTLPRFKKEISNMLRNAPRDPPFA